MSANDSASPPAGSSGASSDKPNQNTKLFLRILCFALIFTFLFNFFNSTMAIKGMSEIKYSKFLDLLEADKLEKVEIQAGKLVIYPNYEKIDKKDEIPVDTLGKVPLYTGRIPDNDLKDELRKHNVEFYTPIVENNAILNFFLYWILPLLIMYGGLTLLIRFMGKRMGGGLFGVGKSNAKIYMQKETGVTFKDVAGQDEAKESLEEIVDFLHHPDKYKKIGARQPKGALLVGPPGTGKTLLAKAVAGEADVTFMSLSGSDFEEMYVGVGASRVRDLFKQAQQNAPCIVFIDEIDAVGKSRNDNSNYSEQTLNQLLSEMDGFDSSKGVVILAATNRPEVLDKALLRPGRFDRRIIVEKPDLIGRENILKVHAKAVCLDDDVDLHQLALATSGAVGADLANMVNEAALRAVRFGRELVKQEDLMEAVEVIIAGKEKKDRILSDKEKRIVAFHEIGHALAAAMQKNTQPVQKITIVPRTMGALGYTMQMPEDEKYLESKDEILAEIVILLAGRSAEEIIFNTATSGAANDIERASKLARYMITQLGMSDSFDMMGLESIQSRYLDGRSVLNCSEITASEIDKEVLEIIRSCHKKAKDILEDNREALSRSAEYLICKETITGEEFMTILDDIKNGTETISLSKADDNDKATDDKSDDNKADDSSSNDNAFNLNKPSDSEINNDKINENEIINNKAIEKKENDEPN